MATASARLLFITPLQQQILSSNDKTQRRHHYHVHGHISSFTCLSSSNTCSLSLSSNGSRVRHTTTVAMSSLSSSPSPSPSSPPSTRLYVSGLSFRTNEEGLRNAFKNFGQLVEVKLVMDKIANRPRGFAFLRYSTEEEARKAIEGMHGKFLDGRVIFVEVAKPRSELRQSVRQSPQRY